MPLYIWVITMDAFSKLLLKINLLFLKVLIFQMSLLFQVATNHFLIVKFVIIFRFNPIIFKTLNYEYCFILQIVIFDYSFITNNSFYCE